MTIEIREIADTDQAALEELWVEAWRSAMPEIDFEARRGWLRAQLASFRAEGSHIVVASEHGQPVGFIAFDNTGHVDQLAVGPAHQNKGLGRRMLDAARNRIGGRLRLSVNADNARAVSFYLKNGFLTTGRGFNPNSGLPIITMMECVRSTSDRQSDMNG